MSEEKLYMVKNDKGEYWDFDCAGFWRLETAGCYETTTKEQAELVVDEYGGHIVTFIEEPKKVVLTNSYPAFYISAVSGKDEELLMNAYVNGYTVANEKKYYVKVFNQENSFLNMNVDNNLFVLDESYQSKPFKTQFTKSEIKQLEHRDDIPLDWGKVKLIEVDDENN